MTSRQIVFYSRCVYVFLLRQSSVVKINHSGVIILLLKTAVEEYTVVKCNEQGMDKNQISLCFSISFFFF